MMKDTNKKIGVKKMLDRTVFECRVSLFVYCLPVLLFSVSIDIVINASAAVTLLEQRPEKIFFRL